MATFTTTAPGTLEEVLGWNGVQPWRASYLVTCRGVSVRRDGVAVDVASRGAQTELKRNDVITVVDPVPEPCAVAEQRVTASPGRFRDYTMVGERPPNELHIPRLMTLFTLLPQTVALQPSSNALEDFVKMLRGDAKVANPVRDLMIGAHATPHGAVAIRAAAADRVANLTFERLVEAVDARTLAIEPRHLEPRLKDQNGKDIPPRFLICGCGIGASLPYLRKFKEALGGGLRVVGPRFEHAVGAITGRTEALYEFLAYEFLLVCPKPLASDKDIAGKYIAQGLRDYDDKPIPERMWDQWIPRGKPPQSRTLERPVMSAAYGRNVLAKASFRVETESFPGGEILVDAPTDPGTDAARRQALENELGTRSPFQFTHLWPGFVRLGYSSVPEMVAGFTWTFSHNITQGKLRCTGERTAYLVHEPLLDAKGALIHNFYPIRPPGKPTIQFTDADARFFATV